MFLFLLCYHHIGYRDTTNATWYNERNWKWWRHKNMFGKKLFILAIFLIFLDDYFFVAIGKRNYRLQIQLQRNLLMTNEYKNIFFSFVKRVFTKPSLLRSVFSDHYTSFVQMLLWLIYCCDSRASIDAFLWAPGSVNIHWIREWFKAWFFFFFFLLGYNLPRGTIHHTAVNQHNLGQQTRILIFMHWDKTL